MNVATLLGNAVQAHRERIALRYGSQSMTYGELWQQAAALGSALRARGLERGDRVGLFARNCPEYVVSVFGAFHAGLVIVPINAKLVAEELEGILRDCGARALILSADTAAVATDVKAESIAVTAVIGGPDASFETLLNEGDRAALPVEVDGAVLAWLFYTSGTTGRPKGAMLSHRNLTAMTLAELANVCDFQPRDVVLHVAPLSHGSGLYLLGAMAHGAQQLIFDGPSYAPDAILRVIERDRVSVIAFMAPTMIAMLVESAVAADTTSLRAVIYGGGPIHLATATKMLERFGQVFVQIYGMGEIPMTISYLPRESHALADPEGLVSAGYRQLGVDVQVLDESDEPVVDGHAGIVCVRGDVVTSGYWRNSEASAAALRNGWMHTGDVGRFDERGRLHLLDRVDDTIISGGTNIYPREVEEVLMRHPAVHEAVVFGIPDELWGESVAAAVVAVVGAATREDDLVEWCRSHLASFKKPKRVFFVEELPKNAYGKVLRRVVRSRVAGVTPVVDDTVRV